MPYMSLCFRSESGIFYVILKLHKFQTFKTHVNLEFWMLIYGIVLIQIYSEDIHTGVTLDICSSCGIASYILVVFCERNQSRWDFIAVHQHQLCVSYAKNSLMFLSELPPSFTASLANSFHFRAFLFNSCPLSPSMTSFMHTTISSLLTIPFLVHLNS